MSSSVTGSHFITKEFLQEALVDYGKVLEFNVGAGAKPGDNYTSVMYAINVKIEKSNNTQQDLHIMCKCLPTSATRQDFLKTTNMFHKEIGVYSKWVPALYDFQRQVLGNDKILKLPFAPFVAGHAVDYEDPNESHRLSTKGISNPTEHYVMMANMKHNGFDMADKVAGLNYDQVALCMDAYSTIHAMSWCYKQRNGLESVVPRFPFLTFDYRGHETRDIFEKVLISDQDICLNILEQTLGLDSPVYKGTKEFANHSMKVMDYFFDNNDPGEVTYLDKFMRVKPAVNPEEQKTPWKIVVHGDCWTNNLLFRHNPQTDKPDEVILIDLQLCREGCPTTDLAYLLYANTTREFRNEHLQTMLKLYHDRFLDVCKLFECKPLPGFTFEEFISRFHRSKLFGFSMLLFAIPAFNAGEMEDIDSLETSEDVDMGEMFSKVFKSVDTTGPVQDKLLGVAHEMYESGII